MSSIKKIDPNPLISSGVEIRFKTDFFKNPDTDLIPFFFPIFSSKLKNFKDRKNVNIILPENAISYHTDYIFSDEIHSIGVGKNVILFEILKDYPLWEQYFSFIKGALLDIQNKGFNSTIIERIGLRYISLLPDEESLNIATNINCTMEFNGFKQNTEIVRTEYSNGTSIGLILQIAKGVKQEKSGNPGIYVDIDAFNNAPGLSAFDENFFKLIEELHSLEKNMFENVLSESYKKKLNITLHK